MDKVKDIWNNLFIWKLTKTGKIAEASSKHWLTATWRPALMWICIIVIFNNYILAPFVNILFGTSLELSIPEPMWNLLTIGIGGYIAGRSGEKIAQNWTQKG